MAFSIQTNINSLVSQENLRVNSDFQSRTIQRLTSGYRINSSGDDAAGLAVANKFRSDVAELQQGVRNANDGISTLQTVDGGLNNISKILDRMKTLATQAASTTFTGDRNTLDSEYTKLLTEINRQAANIGLSGDTAAGAGANKFMIDMKVYIGGGNNQTNAVVEFNLTSARVDSGSAVAGTGLKVGGTTIVGGDNTLALAAASADLTGSTMFLAGDSQDFAFTNIGGAGGKSVTVTVSGGSAGLTGAQVLDSLNGQLSAYGINATTDANGKLSFVSSTVGFTLAAVTDAATGTSLTTGYGGGNSGASATNGTGNALAALTQIASAVSQLGSLQGKVGTAQNQLQYAINLAQSQVSNFSAADSRIRDADVAAEAANLTKAQVLQQASIAAMAQANSAPQQVLALLRG
jgi:flagellin